jgi:hypothetical protein
VYSAESCRQTDTNESLADDNTVISLINRGSLLAIREILNDFSVFSGLKCNFEKTSIMPINQITEEERQWIGEAGFTITNKIKLLGANITANFADLSENFVIIEEKIVSQINFGQDLGYLYLVEYQWLKLL